MLRTPSLPVRVLAALCAVVVAFAGLAQAAEPEGRDAPEAPAPEPATTLPGPGRSAFLGIEGFQTPSGFRIGAVRAESPAERAGLRAGDILQRAAGRRLGTRSALRDLIGGVVPGDVLRLTVERDDATVSIPVEVGERAAATLPGSRPRFRIAVVQVTFADEGPATDRRTELERLLFERTGRRGPGASVADYYADQSHGSLALGGEVLAPVRLAHPRSHYSPMLMGGRRGTLFDEAARAVLERHGDDLLERVDALAFVYPGPAETRAGLALWPHRSTVSLDGRHVSYYVHPVGCAEGDAVGVHCHEVGHLLGLPDEYGVGHRTGSGDFCLMALGHRGAGPSAAHAPFSLCAHCRLQLGWITPRIVDPRRPDRIVLEPIAAGKGHSVVVPLDPRCTEYLLLEVRSRTGFDRELPCEGLLVWHVGGRASPGQGPYRMPVDLVEAHGIDTFDASLVRPGEIAFPTARARDLTGATRPRIQARPGGFAVRLTGIARKEDGSVGFSIGSTTPVSQQSPFPYVPTAPEKDGAVVRADPITGVAVRFYPHRFTTSVAFPGSSSGSER